MNYKSIRSERFLVFESKVETTRLKLDGGGAAALGFENPGNCVNCSSRKKNNIHDTY